MKRLIAALAIVAALMGAGCGTDIDEDQIDELEQEIREGTP